MSDPFLDLLAAAQAVVEGDGELNVKEMGAAVARLRKALVRVRAVPRSAVMTRAEVEEALERSNRGRVYEAASAFEDAYTRPNTPSVEVQLVDLVCAVLGLP